MSGFLRAVPKPAPRVKEPKRLRQVSAKRQTRIDAGEERAGLARSPMRRRPTVDETQDQGKLAFVRAQACVGLAWFPGHKCWGRNTVSHLRDHTGASLRESSDFTHCKCSSLHGDWEARRGPFKGWSNERRVDWHRDRDAEMHALWLALPEERRVWWREVGAQRPRDDAMEPA